MIMQTPLLITMKIQMVFLLYSRKAKLAIMVQSAAQ